MPAPIYKSARELVIVVAGTAVRVIVGSVVRLFFRFLVVIRRRFFFKRLRIFFFVSYRGRSEVVVSMVFDIGR